MREFTRPVFSSFPLHLHEQISRSGLCISRNPIGQAWRTLHHHQLRCSHNLSNRYKTLEAKIRPSEVQRRVAADSKPQQVAPEIEAQAPEMEKLHKGGSKSVLRPKPRSLKGVLIPIKPPPPASDECCMSSCTVCVYDLYATALEDYQDDLVKARNALTVKGVPVNEWPLDVLSEDDRTKRLEQQKHKAEGGVDAGRRMGVTGESERERQMAVIIGAFVKFEQSLREKRRAEKMHSHERTLQEAPTAPNR